MAHTDIVFDGPPGPEAGRFVEVEDASGKSVRFGEWVRRPDGFWALRIAASPALIAAAPATLKALRGCLNYIENTEAELGIRLDCGNAARAVIAKATGESA
jgi:hypothetical protein